MTTDDISTRENDTMEFHLSGSTPNGRINRLGGYYSLEEEYRSACRSSGHVRVGYAEHRHGVSTDRQYAPQRIRAPNGVCSA